VGVPRTTSESGSGCGIPDGPEATEKVRTTQRPVYYVSEVLHGAKARYLEAHKFVYALLVASRKLRHYFQAHKIVVVTSYPIRAILHNSNATGSIAKWAAELAEFQIDFQPRSATKSQVLADFIAEWTPASTNPEDPSTGPAQPSRPAQVFTEPHWTLFFDGSARKEGNGAGVVLVNPKGEQVKYMVRLEFEATNNMAEYEALIFGLTVARSLEIKQLLAKGDSQLVVRQVRGDCRCNNP
jgi:hypothetical protein